ncbi:MAG: substrate-binding domain-containing protein [Clostridia bacterium]
MKKIMAVLVAGVMSFTMFVGCDKVDEAKTFDATKGITVISREQGSGTRGAFIELFKVEVKDGSGSKQDKTTDAAIIQNNTEGVISQVSGNEYAIGYISLGSLNDTVTALKIDGVDASAANVKNGSYKVSRPFEIITKGETSPVTKDFINYIMSKDGQAVVSKSYIAAKDDAVAFTSDKSAGKVVVGGSSSVSPVMEKLIESYKTVNSNVTVELQTTDSGSGIKNVGASYDIGMSSRELTDAEKEGKTVTKLAIDGIAVIVNKVNTTKDLKAADVTKIYTGNSVKWNELV